MEPTEKLTRPWWKKRRTQAVVIPLLLVSYPASFGPLMYLNQRGWFPGELLLSLHRPLDSLISGPVGQATGYHAYLDWCAATGKRHRASD